MNPLISMMAQQANAQNPAVNMLNQFESFRKQWTPEQAQQKINQMLASGQITQQQLEQAKQLAQTIASMRTM